MARLRSKRKRRSEKQTKSSQKPKKRSGKKKQSESSSWILAIVCTICALLIAGLVSHLFFSFGLLQPYDRNGLNKVKVTCDGFHGEISTQRYYGFNDYDVSTYKEFSDLPIVIALKCDEFSAQFERRADLLDRSAARIWCGEGVVGTSDAGAHTLDCEDTITIEVMRW